MNTIRDIIEAATQGGWKWGEYDQLEALGETIMFPSCACGAYKYERSIEDMAPYDGNKKFIATFDPEHVALMEDVVDAAWSSADEEGLYNALTRLDEYRKKKGLE